MKALGYSLIAILICGALVACGDDDSGGGASSEADFEDEYVEIREDLMALGEEVSQDLEAAPSATDEELAAQFEESAGEAEELLGELESLDPPSDVEAEYDAYLGALETVIADLNAISDAAAESDIEAAADAGAQLRADAEASTAAREALDEALGVDTGG